MLKSLHQTNPVVYIVLVLLCLSLSSAQAQNLNYERDRHDMMLTMIKNDIKKHYYDVNFHGINLEERFNTAKERIKKANSIGEMSGIIAQALIDFDDSHLYFIPPGKASKTDYGWEMQMIGERCLVTKVKEKSDAEAQGLRPGDEIYSIDGYAPLRENLWKINYFYKVLRPRPILKVEVIKPDGKQLTLELKAKITEGKIVKDLTGADLNEFIRTQEDAYNSSRKQFFYDKIENLIIWKMPSFSLDPNNVDDIMDKVKKRGALILDLRGNGGGRVDMLKRLVGHFFNEEIKVGDRKGRKEMKPEIAKSRGKDGFTGKLVVLVDSESGSASEVFARVVQLEKRGTVIGDQTAGAVMESMYYGHSIGIDVIAPFGVSVTIADLIMKDGKSLEKVGVAPDEKALPAALDLANKRDPVLARAAQILGFSLTPEQAGQIFPEDKQN